MKTFAAVEYPAIVTLELRVPDEYLALDESEIQAWALERGRELAEAEDGAFLSLSLPPQHNAYVSFRGDGTCIDIFNEAE